MKVVLLIPLMLLLTHQVRGEVTLAEDRKAHTAIFVPPRIMADDKPLPAGAPFMDKEAEAQRQRLRESVRDLAHYLGQMSGAGIAIHERPPAENDTVTPILIGEYATERFGDVGKKSGFRQGWRATIRRDGIGLQGESDEAASYAIYEILDRLGCRWFLPGDLGEVIPRKSSLSLTEADISEAPQTLCRTITYGDDAFRRRNRLGGFVIRAQHALEMYITEEQRAQHPEWRAIINGKPHKTRLKWSNPEVADAIADAIIAKLDKDYTPSVSLSPDDGGVFDESDDPALDAGDWDSAMNQTSITDRYIVLCNRIAERVTKKYPDVLFGFLAYVQYTRPPVREKLHPNLVPQIAPINYCRAHTALDGESCPSRAQIREIVEGWAKVARRISYYNYMFHLAEVTVPYPMIRQMSRELPMIYKNKVVFWQPETMSTFEHVLPGMWLSLRMAWDPDSDPQKILDEFYPAFYGAAAGSMRRYWEIFDDAWTQSPEHAGSLWSYSRRFTPERLRAARETIQQALDEAETPMEYRRVALQERALRQFERLMSMRTDLNEGREWKTLDVRMTEWLGTQIGLGNEFESDFSFGKVYWTPRTVGGEYIRQFVEATYRDAARMAQNCVMIGTPVRQWKWAFLNNPALKPGFDEHAHDMVLQGETQGWQQPDFDDSSWKITDVGTDTWADLNLADSFGTMWYRQTVRVPDLPPGKRIFLWIAATDGSAKVYVNGRHIPFRNDNGEEMEAASGYAQPFQFDITEAIRPNAENQITVAGTRLFINELGTGGLLGPVCLFQEK